MPARQLGWIGPLAQADAALIVHAAVHHKAVRCQCRETMAHDTPRRLLEFNLTRTLPTATLFVVLTLERQSTRAVCVEWSATKQTAPQR